MCPQTVSCRGYSSYSGSAGHDSWIPAGRVGFSWLRFPRGKIPVRRVALVVGDTPGHFFPALAVATAYKQRCADVDILFFGPPNESAALAARHGWQYCSVPGGQLARVGLGTRFRSALRTCVGVIAARRRLQAHETQMIVSFGAYAAGAVVLAGKTLGVATAINEGNVRAGLANRMLARFAQRIYLGQAATSAFPVHRALATGWPIRSEIAALSRMKRTRESGRLRVLVCSGSRGGSLFAEEIPILLAELRARGFAVSVWHQCADVPAEPIAQEYQRVGVEAQVAPFVDDMAEAYQWADFAIARGGAGTLAEVAAAALPSLIVPLGDAAENHQLWNAQRFVEAGAALCLRENEWDTAVAAEQISNIVSDPVRWEELSAMAASLAVPSAADAIVDDCERTLTGHI